MKYSRIATSAWALKKSDALDELKQAIYLQRLSQKGDNTIGIKQNMYRKRMIMCSATARSKNFEIIPEFKQKWMPRVKDELYTGEQNIGDNNKKGCCHVIIKNTLKLVLVDSLVRLLYCFRHVLVSSGPLSDGQLFCKDYIV